MAYDLDELNRLRAEYQRRSEDVGQVWVERSDLDVLAGVEAAANEAGGQWLRAVHAAWPEIADVLAERTET